MKDDSYFAELNQIRREQAKIVKEIERLQKGKGSGKSADLDRIRDNARKLVTEIDQIKKRVQNEHRKALTTPKPKRSRKRVG